MKLILTVNKSFSCTSHRLSCEKTKLKIILERWQKAEMIRPSESEYAPIVLTKKRNDKLRLYVDFSKITRDNFPLSLIKDQLDLLRQILSCEHARGFDKINIICYLWASTSSLKCPSVLREHP